MLQYITIIISFLLGIIGVLAKTEKPTKDVQKHYFKKLSPFGLIVIALLCLTVVISIFTEISKREDSRITLQNNINKAKEDSTRQALTINLLEEQIVSDSVRFATTLSLFGEQIQQQTKTLENTNSQLSKQNQTLYEINRNSTKLDNLALIAWFRYDFKFPKIQKYADEIAAKANNFALKKLEEGTGIHNASKTRWRFNDLENGMQVNIQIVNEKVILDYVELFPNSILIPDGYGPETNGPSIFGELTLKFDIYKSNRLGVDRYPNLGLKARGWSPDKKTSVKYSTDPNGYKPSAISMTIHYLDNYIRQKVYTTAIERGSNDRTVFSVLDLKNSLIEISRLNCENYETQGEITYLTMLWGENLSNYIGFDNEKLKWTPKNEWSSTIKYKVSGEESPVMSN